VVENPTAPGATGPDVLTVTIGGALPPADMPGSGVEPHVAVNGPLGAQFLVWETATALAGRVLGINPFDQPNVTESKENTQRLLADGPAGAGAGLHRGSHPRVRARVHCGGLPEPGCWSRSATPATSPVLAYLDRFGESTLEQIRPALARSGGRPSRTDGDLAICTRPDSSTREDRGRAPSSRSPAR
jgi:glucose-6-phosphate isomerase